MSTLYHTSPYIMALAFVYTDVLSGLVIIPLTTISVVRVDSNGRFRMVENSKANGTESDWLPLAKLDNYMLNNILTMLKSMNVEE